MQGTKGAKETKGMKGANRAKVADAVLSLSLSSFDEPRCCPPCPTMYDMFIAMLESWKYGCFNDDSLGVH